ncbi:RNA exonuclease ngl2 [Sorochytrium milnesiophthora]
MSSVEMLPVAATATATATLHGRLTPRFRLMTWNLLAQCLIHRDQFPLSPNGSLRQKPRVQRLLNDLDRLNPDVACLQEVDAWDTRWAAEFSQRGYHAVYEQKPAGLHGCAIVWKQDKFRLLESDVFRFDDSPLTHPTSVWPTTQNIAMVVALESLSSSSSNAPSEPASGPRRRMVLSNHHLYWRPEAEYVRLRQLYVLLDAVTKMQARHDNAPAVICGDFNATPYSAAYLVLTKHTLTDEERARCEPPDQEDPFPGSIPPGAAVTTHISTSSDSSAIDQQQAPSTNTNPTALVHQVVDYKFCRNPLPVDLLLAKLAPFPRCVSVYGDYVRLDHPRHPRHPQYRADVGEPAWTTYTEWKGTLDYMFLLGQESADKLVLEEVLRLPAEEEIRPGIPNERWGSDHLPLMCTLRWAD